MDRYSLVLESNMETKLVLVLEGMACMELMLEPFLVQMFVLDTELVLGREDMYSLVLV